LPYSVGQKLWLDGPGKPRRVAVVSQVLYNRPAYRVRLLPLKGDEGSAGQAVVDGIYLTIEKPTRSRYSARRFGAGIRP